MISSLLFLSASLLASPVFISEVKATREAGHLRVEVVGDGGIDPEGARTRLDNGVLLIYLGGTRVRADNRAWDLADGAGEIRAHRHRKETELVVPLAGNGCSGPVELTATPTGISALVGCDGARGSAPRAAQPAPVKVAKNLDQDADTTPANTSPKMATKVATTLAIKIPVKSGTKDQQLKALVQLPAGASEAAAAVVPSVDPAPAAEAAAPVAPVKASAAPEAAPVPAVVAKEPRTRVTFDPTAGLQKLPEAPVPGAAATPSAGPTSSGGLGTVAVPALLLAGLAVAAFLFARRRRGTLQRHIQILETTSLGPKRSLVVARVGDDTFILASSEAGITLLETRPGSALSQAVKVSEARQPAPVAEAVASGPTAVAPAGADLDFDIELSQPLEEALADIPEPDFGGHAMAGRGGFRAIEGGLAGLFRSRKVAEEPADDSSVRFDDLLEDSVEDQELRRKLAAGMSARVR